MESLMTKTIMILAIATAFVAGSIATGTIAFADDDDELSQLACEAGKAMTGILLEDDDEITDILCGAQLQGPPGADGMDGARGADGMDGARGADGAPGPSGLPCDGCVDSNSILDNTIIADDISNTNMLIFTTCKINVLSLGPGNTFDMICSLVPAGVVSAGMDLEVVATLKSDPSDQLIVKSAKIHPTLDNRVLLRVQHIGQVNIMQSTPVTASAIVFNQCLVCGPP